MSAKITITKEDQSNWSTTREFGQEVITIGRSNTNTLMLDDPEKVVSRCHAELAYSDGKYYIKDCQSQNATYLNNKKLPPEKPLPLSEGDIIKIGNYYLRCENLLSEGPAPDKQDATILMVNPFEEDLRIFAGVMNKIKRNFDDADKENREDQLKLALHRSMMFNDWSAVADILISGLQQQAEIPEVEAKEDAVFEEPPAPPKPKTNAPTVQEDVQASQPAKEKEAESEAAAEKTNKDVYRGSIISLFWKKKTGMRKFH